MPSADNARSRARLTPVAARRALALAGLLALATACSPAIPDPGPAPDPTPGAVPLVPASPLQSALDSEEVIVVSEAGTTTTEAGNRFADTISALDAVREAAASQSASLTVDYPLEGSLFPPGFVPPVFLWHDDTAADAWLVRVEYAEGAPLLALVSGPPEPQGWIDPRAIGPTNSPYEPTPYQASARSWEVPQAVWDEMQKRSHESRAEVSFHGFSASDPAKVLSSGSVGISTSKDEVGAPIFYRDVPLMPSVSAEDGKIRPLAQHAVPIIEWRLRDVTEPDTRLVLTGITTCANCHSFSSDGKWMGMDVDGPQGDKGSYALVPIEKQTVMDDAHVVTWNAFPGRKPFRKTIGFLSRISPDGRYAVSSVNEALYVANFVDYKFLQVFYPTRGILGWTSTETHEIKALPGADDDDFVHTNAVWSPDGKWLVFCRAEAYDPPRPGVDDMARYPNDEREPTMHFSLYKMPFNEGRGGPVEAIPGASHNGMSNTFPKISPDGKWIVYTQCKNGLLMRPDGRLRIIPFEGGESRELECNTDLMNSWHSFSPNGRWMVFTSKTRRPYTQLFITHLDEEGHATPPVLVPNCTADNRAVNLPEFLNASPDAIEEIAVPAIGHDPVSAYYTQSVALLEGGRFEQAIPLLEKIVRYEPAHVESRVNLAVAYERSGMLEKAMAEFERATEIDPANSRAHGQLAAHRAWDDAGAPGIEQARAAVDAAPASPEAWRLLALTLVHLDEVDEAYPLVEKLTAESPDDLTLRRATANMNLVRGNARAAIPLLESIAAADPADFRSRTLIAWLSTLGTDGARRDPSKALTHAQAACRVTSDANARALDAFAGALSASGDLPRAVEAARAAKALAERDAPSLAYWIAKRVEIYENGARLGE